MPSWHSALAVDEPPSADGVLPEKYIDQLIDPATGEQDFDPVYRERMEQPPGRRYLSTGLVHFREDRDGRGESHETGVQLLYRRETRDYGEFETEAALLNVDSASGRTTDPATGTLLTLRQRDYALNNDWIMQNSLGVERTIADPLLANSFRFKLPSSLQSGLNTHLSSDHGDIRFGIGRLGNIDTGQVQTFDTTGGQLVSAGYSRAISDNYHAGLQLVSVNDAANVIDHRSVAGVLQYDDPELRRRVQGHVLFDSEGAGGIWVDGDARSGSWRHRAGLYRLDNGLLWTDTTMAGDQQGVYMRSERRSLRYHLTGGIELNSTDIDNRATVNGLRTASLFVNGSRYINLRTSIGGTLGFRDVTSTDNIATDDSRELELSVYASRRMPFGTTRIQLLGADLHQGTTHGNRGGITWDQSWRLPGSLELSSTLGYERESGTGNDENRSTAGILLNHDLGSNFRWDASLNWTHTDRTALATNGDSVNASLALLWRFLPGWEAILRARLNEASESGATGLVATDFTEREKTLLLSIRHNRSSGRSFERYGRETGKSGYGTIEGMVFFDDNRDGVRQANERIAVGLYVYLDRRYQKATDRDGRFEFTPVSSGEHGISVMLEDIPLPWGLEDEAPRRIMVNVRGRTTVLFPLVRFDE